MTGQNGQRGYGLGVDLGTSNTVAVLRWPDGRTRSLLFDGQPLIPSGVYLDEAGRPHVGRDAQRLAQADPARYEPNPKRRVDEPGVLLGDREVPTVDLLAAVLGAVARAAVEAVGFLPPAALTHPAAWGARRRDVLAAAVARAGWPPVGGGTVLVPEPVAAARYFADVLRRPVPVGASLGVFDFGGGTLDIAVVRNEGVDAAGRARFAVLGSGGVAELGGLDLDSALVDHLGALLGRSAPDAWRRLSQPRAAGEWRERRQFWDEVRAAKEMLSRSTTAPVAVPGVDQALHLTRDELDRVIIPLLRRGVYEAAAVIAASHLHPQQLAGLFLVGGSSRVPMVARLLHAELGVAPTVLEQPELPVAEGALAELAPPATAFAPVVAPGVVAPGVVVPGVVVPVNGFAGPPGAGPPGAGTAALAGAAAGFAAPASASAGPAQGSAQLPPSQPGPPAPVSGAGTATMPAPPVIPTSPGAPHPYTQAPPVPPRRPLYRRAVAWIGAGAVVALLALVATWFVVLRDPYPALDYQPAGSPVAVVPMGDETYYSNALTWVSGDIGYVAWQVDTTLEVRSVTLPGGKERWKARVSGPKDAWTEIVGLRDGVALFPYRSSSAPATVTVLDAADGHERWKVSLGYSDQLLFYDKIAVRADREGNRLVGLDTRTGETRWSQPDPGSASGSDPTVLVVATPDDLVGPASNIRSFAPNWGDDERLVQIGADKSARVINSTTGKVVKSRPNVASPDDTFVAYDGQLYIATRDNPYRVDAYDLATLSNPRSIYSATDETRRVGAMSPCGKDRVCVLDTASSDDKSTELVKLNAIDGGQVWRKKSAGMDGIIPVGDHVLLRATSSSEPRSMVLDPDGGLVMDRPGATVRLDAGNVLVFASALATSTADLSVAGVGVRSGKKPTELGLLPDVDGAECSWNRAVILCPSAKGAGPAKDRPEFHIWQFVAD